MVDSVNQTGGAGKAIASAFIPGLGQFIDGRNKQGAIYMGGNVALGIGSIALSKRLTKDMFEAGQKAMDAMGKGSFDVSKYLNTIGKSKSRYALIALGIATTALWIANIVDAAKGNRNKKA